MCIGRAATTKTISLPPEPASPAAAAKATATTFQTNFKFIALAEWERILSVNCLTSFILTFGTNAYVLYMYSIFLKHLMCGTEWWGWARFELFHSIYERATADASYVISLSLSLSPFRCIFTLSEFWAHFWSFSACCSFQHSPTCYALLVGLFVFPMLFGMGDKYWMWSQSIRNGCNAIRYILLNEKWAIRENSSERRS